GSGFVARKVDAGMDRLKTSYQHSLNAMLGVRKALIATIAVVVFVALGAVGMFMTLPSELVPPEDRGSIFIRVQGPEGAGYDYTRDIMMGIEPILASYAQTGEVESYFISAPGWGGGNNGGNASLSLTDWGDRERSADEIAQDLNRQLRSQPGAQVNAFARSGLSRGGGGNSVEMVMTGPEYGSMFQWVQPIMAAAQANPNLSRPRLDYEPNSPR
ncbi:MAG TPA: multidrug transporter AcrB, partial [Brevundimonas sp.]|nr:multidrug transporter AcrB [Brevundimonas sp.]